MNLNIIKKMLKQQSSCIITTQQLVSIFGNEKNKKTYKKNHKIANSTRDKLLKIAMQYCDIKSLGLGKFEISNIYDNPIHVRGILQKERLFLTQFFNNKNLFTTYSYEELCKLINLSILTDKTDIDNQLNALKNFINFKIEIINNELMIHIFEIYFIILNKNEACFQYISYPDYYDYSGIYKIINTSEIYIGSTQNLYRRFMDHFKDYLHINKTYNILHNNGQFEIIEIIQGDILNKDLQTKEYEYIKDYIFNYSIGQENKILINSVIPDKTGNLINLGKRLQVKFLKNKNTKLDKILLQD